MWFVPGRAWPSSASTARVTTSGETLDQLGSDLRGIHRPALGLAYHCHGYPAEHSPSDAPGRREQFKRMPSKTEAVLETRVRPPPLLALPPRSTNISPFMTQSRVVGCIWPLKLSITIAPRTELRTGAGAGACTRPLSPIRWRSNGARLTIWPRGRSTLRRARLGKLLRRLTVVAYRTAACGVPCCFASSGFDLECTLDAQHMFLRRAACEGAKNLT